MIITVENHEQSGTPPICNCCGRTHMRITFKIVSDSAEFGTFNLGAICAGKWFGVNLTGNLVSAQARLARKVHSMTLEALNDVAERIRTSQENAVHSELYS